MGQRIPPLQLVGESDESYVRRFIAWDARFGWVSIAVHVGAIVGVISAVALVAFR